MIDVYYWTTPNGHKITMFLEETGLQYKIMPVNIGKGEQFQSQFLAISHNKRIPALNDHAPAGSREPITDFDARASPFLLTEENGPCQLHVLSVSRDHVV